MRRRLIALLCLLFASQPVLAELAVCSGQVTRITQSNGKVIVFLNGSNIGINICSVDVTVITTTPAQCKSYLNQIYLAHVLQKGVELWIYNAPTTSCSSIATNWFPAHVQIVQTLP